MKLPFLALAVLLVSTVSAFSEPGAYERLWYFYAYTMDTSRSKIATGCSRKFSTKSPCTFVQFMTYIDNQGEKANLIPDEIKNVDTTNVGKTVYALKEGHYTGAYDCTLIHSDISGPNDVAKTMEAITGFLKGKLGTANAQRITNLQQVTLGVAKGRQEAAIPKLTEKLAEKGITLKTGQVPVFTDSTDMCEFVDFRATVQESKGKNSDDVRDAIKAVQKNDPGHANNIRCARNGAQTMSEACIG